MIVTCEPFNRKLFDEILPLAKKCWAESTAEKAETCAFYGEREFEIEPDFEAYERLGEALLIVALRKEGVLVGYVIGFSYKALHHKHILGAIADNTYVEPELRSYAPVIAKRFEKEMKYRGVGIIGWPAHPNSPLYGMLESMGYVGDDVVMEKRLAR